MAPSRRRKLICHYCNQKSDYIYDGQITQWECNNCNAANYLDENGEITDPPVAESNPVAPPVRYATTSVDSLLPPSQNASQSNIFCARCLKNQHLYTSSLAQYHVEIDTDSFELEKKNGTYNRFRKDLERRYPQVCKDCEPAALQRMKEAGKAAKSDHLRRLMDKTRESRTKAVKRSILTLDNAGKIIWNLGLYGQLLWDFVIIVSCSLRNQYVFATIPSEIVTTTSRSLALQTLICTLLSSWWSPRYRETSRGVAKQNFNNWYQLQFFTIVLRCLFYYIMGTQFFSDPLSPTTAGVHSVMFILTSMLAISAKNSAQTNTSSLWNNIPENFISGRSRSHSLCETRESMADILDQISSAPHSSHLDTSSRIHEPEPMISSKFLRDSQASVSAKITPGVSPFEPSASIPELPKLRAEREFFIPPTSAKFPSLLETTERETSRFLQTGEIPRSLRDRDDQVGFEEMDWQSTQSPTINFNPRPKVYPQQSIEKSVPNELPTFWYKLPPAPQTPAQKILSHTNNTKGQLSKFNTEQIKPTFFKDPSIKNVESSKQFQENSSQSRSTKQGIEFSPQKFFPPEPASEAGNILADLLTDFSLTNAEDQVKMSSNRINHVIYFTTSTVLLVSVAYGWYKYRISLEQNI
ncbi:hypothetical protein K3495_g945 [Podosphaera aphanis]|nr:hypothetical protein K3495_g945 [Podosphaera aphanis]